MQQAKLSLLLTLSLCALQAQAVMEQDRPYYGNAQYEPFQQAIEGTTPEPSLEERHEISKFIPRKQVNRYYLMLGFGLNGTPLGNFSNATPNTYANFAGKVIHSEVTADYSKPLAIGVGYLWKKTRLELELMRLGTAEFNGVVDNTSPVETFTGSVKTSGLLFNLSYDFYSMRLIKLYGLGTAGLVRDKTKLALATSNGTQHSAIKLAYGVGFGARWNMFASAYLEARVRYLFLGKSKFEDFIGGTKHLALTTDQKRLGLGLAVSYLL